MEIWYPIPGFKLYVITKSGKVKNISTGKIHKGSLCGSGYWNYHLIQDNGVPIVAGVHRLLALTFIENDDPKKNIVNHIDGDRLNNDISNLEWVTLLENIIHAGKYGLSKKCLSITVRNIKTKEILKFDSIRSAGEHIGISRDSMRYRYWKFNGSVFPEGYQYHKGEYSGVWEDPENPQEEMLKMEQYILGAKEVLIKDLSTNVVAKYDTLTAASKVIKMRRQTLGAKLRAINCPVFKPHLQVKFNDGSPWREPKSLKEEFKMSLGHISVVVENVASGEKRYFDALKEVMTSINMTRSTLLGRLKYGKKKTVDGYYYYHEI